MTEREILLDAWHKVIKHPAARKKFAPMGHGRHDEIGDGWRTITLIDPYHDRYFRITLERNPAGYWLYSKDRRCSLGEDGLRMCIEFDDVRGADEISVDQLAELL